MLGSLKRRRENKVYVVSILIVIIASTCYTLFQNFIPDGVNPIVALGSMYLSGLVLALVFYTFTRKERVKGGDSELKKSVNWRILAFAATNILIDYGFLLAFRNGWEVSLLNIVSNVLILIGLMILGVMFFKEKLTVVNMVGLVVGVMGLVLLSI